MILTFAWMHHFHRVSKSCKQGCRLVVLLLTCGLFDWSTKCGWHIVFPFYLHLFLCTSFPYPDKIFRFGLRDDARCKRGLGAWKVDGRPNRLLNFTNKSSEATDKWEMIHIKFDCWTAHATHHLHIQLEHLTSVFECRLAGFNRFHRGGVCLSLLCVWKQSLGFQGGKLGFGWGPFIGGYCGGWHRCQKAHWLVVPPGKLLVNDIQLMHWTSVFWSCWLQSCRVLFSVLGCYAQQ